MIKLSVKKPYLTFVAVVIILVIGFVSMGRMKVDLLPEISMPYMLIITTEPGATPEKVEADVAKPLERALGTISGVEQIQSNSAENYCLTMLTFTDNTNMDSAMVRVSAAINRTELPDICGQPNIMEISMDMMATMYTTVYHKDMDITELSDFTEEVVIPYFERQEGVANITAIGKVSETVEVRLNEKRIDEINEDILVATNDKLADAKEKIDKGETKLNNAKKELDKKSNELSNAKNDANSGISSAMLKLDQANATKAAYEASLSGLQASKSALLGEKKAYEQNDIEGNYKKINDMFAQMSESMGTAAASMGVEIPSSVADAIAHPDKFEAFKTWATQAGFGDGLSAITVESMETLYNIVEKRIPQIDTAVANLNTEIKAAEAIVKNINKQMKDIDKNYEKALTGALDSAAGFGSGDAQISAGKTSIDDAIKELDTAKENYEESKKAAIENANIDKLLSLEALSGIIYAQNFAMPAGYVDDKNDNQWLLKVGDEYKSLKDIKNMVLCKVPGAGKIKLSDVADITLIDNADQTYTKYNGDDAILLAIYKTSTANTSEVADRCKEAMEKLAEDHEGLELVTFSDQSQFISLFLESVLSSIAIGALLAVIVLALFLRSVKPTLVVAFSIPFSVLFAIIIMYFSGINIHVMSLAGLGLAIGMLVDNSIVVIENICRLREKGVSAARAAVQGTKQVAAPIIASTITTVCVFLPMIFTDGMIRDLVVPFALTISYALTASLLVALTIVPTMSSIILKKVQPKEQKLFTKIQNVYGKVLAWCLRFKIVTLAVALGLLIFSIYEVFRMGIVVVPSMTGDSVTIMATPEEGATIEEEVAMADDIVEAVMKVEGVDKVGAMDQVSNTNMVAGGAAKKNEEDSFGGFSIFIIPDEGYNTIDEMNGLIDRLKEATKDIKGEITVGSDEASSSMVSSGITVKVFGDDYETLHSIGEDIKGMMDKLDGIEEVSYGNDENEKAIHLVMDKDKIAAKGLTVAQIYQAINEKITTEKTATTMTLDGSDVDVSIVNETNKLLYDNLLDFEIEAKTMGDDGKEVTKTYKLSDFATTEEVEASEVIVRENQERNLQITATVAEGENATLISRELEPLIDEYEAPKGYRIEIAGESEQAMDMVQQMVLALALGLLLIYLVMVAQFQSLLSPFIVLFTIPLAFTGGLIGLLVGGEMLSAMSLMGFMVLMGTVVNNGIVFVDYVNQLRIQGLDKKNAIIATGKTRIRPIFMTAITTILAMSNMIFTRDVSSSMSKGMAIVISGGLLYSTLMTLLVVPIMYDILYRKQPKVIDVGDDLDEEMNDAEEYIKSLNEEDNK